MVKGKHPNKKGIKVRILSEIKSTRLSINFGGGFLGENAQIMIVGITGNIGSGKDTVAKMIQYYFARKSSKKYFDDLGIEKFLKYYESSSLVSVCSVQDNFWQIKKFAYKLKQMVCLLTGCTMENLEDEKFKNSPLSDKWQTISEFEFLNNPHWDSEGKRTYRWMLQKLGTEAIRNNIHQQTWINALFSEYKDKNEFTKIGCKSEFPNWIISDVRFLNEAKSITERGGIILKIIRDKTHIHTHLSETELNEIKPDFTIYNYSDINSLYEMVCDFIELKKFNLV